MKSSARDFSSRDFWGEIFHRTRIMTRISGIVTSIHVKGLGTQKSDDKVRPSQAFLWSEPENILSIHSLETAMHFINPERGYRLLQDLNAVNWYIFLYTLTRCISFPDKTKANVS